MGTSSRFALSTSATVATFVLLGIFCWKEASACENHDSYAACLAELESNVTSNILPTCEYSRAIVLRPTPARYLRNVKRNLHFGHRLPAGPWRTDVLTDPGLKQDFEDLKDLVGGWISRIREKAVYDLDACDGDDFCEESVRNQSRDVVWGAVVAYVDKRRQIYATQPYCDEDDLGKK